MKPLILVVDDDQGIRETVCELLEMENYRVICKENGLKAWETITEGEVPDLLLTDIMMPEMDGFELIERCTAKASLDNMAIVAATASTSIAQRLDRRVIKTAKPFDIEQLLAVVAKALKERV